MRRHLPTCAALITLSVFGCSAPDDGSSYEEKAAPISRAWQSARDPVIAAGGRAALHFTRPGLARGEGETFEGQAAIIEAIEGAEHTLEVCLYEFNREAIIDALVDAIARGVHVRFVGDGDELEDEGYERLELAGLDLSLRRPGDRIMHNKFIIIDHASVITGSMNLSDNGIGRNNNHIVHLYDEDLAALYALEFQQLFDGDFGRDKARLTEARGVQTGEGRVEVHFAPADDPIQVVRRALSLARARVFFMVFSFSHQDLREDLLRLHRAGIQVVGIFDASQAEQRYSVDDALAEAGVPVFIDGNDNRSGFAGGKLHHKVMIIDGGEAEPVVLAGSFNWSVSATRYNDENLLVLRGREYAAPFIDEFCELMEDATLHPSFEGAEPTPCDNWVQPIRINEILPHAAPGDPYEPFVELVNVGHRPLELDGWTLSDDARVRHTFYQTTLPAGGALVITEGLANMRQGLGLDAAGDHVTLKDAWGRVIDGVGYTRAVAGTSFNRVEDGGRRGPFAAHPDLKGRRASPGHQRTGEPWLERPVARLLINEFMPNPSGSDPGQEYVELVNVSGAPLDLTGWSLGDGYNPERHVFEGGELGAGEAVVVFDFGDHDDVPGAVNASSGRLNLDNAGDTVRLRDPEGDIHDEVTYQGTRAGVAKNRAVDGSPQSGLKDHDQVAEAESSPGLRADSSAWGAPEAPEAPETPEELEGPKVIINEVHPNPVGSDLGQEFIELVNVGDAPADLTGYTVGDADDQARHTFGATILAPGEGLVLFDRGDHSGTPNAHASLSGRLSLNNSDEVVVLVDGDGELVDAAFYYGSAEGVSLNRAVDGQPDADLVPHTDLSDAPTSPGRWADGSAF